MKHTNLPWIVVAIVAVALVTGITGMALAHGVFGGEPASTAVGYGGYGGMMGGGYGGMMGGGAGLSGTPAVGVTQVSMTTHDTFSPAIIQVPTGATVTWTNADTDNHTVTFMPMMFNHGSGTMGAGNTFSRTFTVPGIYSYRCIYHAGMVGEVIVSG
jgi:plastocyanin